MIQLILIIVFVISLFSPNILLNKQQKNIQNLDEKKIIINHSRLLFFAILLMTFSIEITEYNDSLIIPIIFYGVILFCIIKLFKSTKVVAEINKKYK